LQAVVRASDERHRDRREQQRRYGHNWAAGDDAAEEIVVLAENEGVELGKVDSASVVDYLELLAWQVVRQDGERVRAGLYRDQLATLRPE
jgi:hypothetical protein